MKWSSEIAHEEASKLGGEQLMKLEKYMSISHGDNWKSLIPITQQILYSIGDNPIRAGEFQNLSTPIVMIRGENDRMLTESETTEFCSGLKNGRYISLENQGHLLQKMETDILLKELLDCL
ncbi:MAG: hypothetical protein R2852_05035 [Bacteroidia bacterium]